MNWLEFFFETGNGNFQWVGISALIASISLVISANNNRRKLNADLVSQSRISWLSDIREVFSNYIQSVNEYNKILESGDTTDVEGNYSSDYNEKLDNVRHFYLLLMIYMRPLEINKTNNDDVTMWNMLVDFQENITGDALGDDYITNNEYDKHPELTISDISKLARKYTKGIWEQAKNNKKIRKRI